MLVTEPTSSSERTVLFADDNQDFQKPVAVLLHKCGYRVIGANDGKDALRKSREFFGVIQLLLADVDMPGMTGIELAIQLNQERPDTRILLISGVDSRLLVRKYGWQFLRKPFSFNTLRDRILALLGEQRSTVARSQNALWDANANAS